jgi:hypothetical protein
VVLFESTRDFQVWRAVVGHSQLLLRSTKTDASPTRIDVLFKPVVAVKLRTVLTGLLVREATSDEADEIIRDAAETRRSDSKVFVIESGNFRGYAIAGVLLTAEDEGEYFERSQLLVDYADDAG